MIEELVSRVFAARDIAHRAHFATSSYLEHEALGEFYSGVVYAIDEVVEAYQGAFFKIDTFEVVTSDYEVDPAAVINYLREESDWIESNRDAIANDSQAVAALVDVLVGVYLKCIYKMEHLA